jgi:hypothetical protein
MISTKLYRLLLALVALLGVVGTASAQTDYRSKSTGMLTVGAGFAGGASMALEPPEGSKYKPLFAWRLTADATYPLNPTVAAMLSLGIDRRGFRSHPQDDDANFADFGVTYFSIYPMFRFSAFTLGVNFGFPMSASTSFKNDVVLDYDESIAPLQTMVEPRLGVVIPLVDEDIGWLGLTLGGGIALAPPTEVPDNAPFNNQMVSGHMGLTWQFGIKGTGRR